MTQLGSNFKDGLELPETISEQALTDFKSSALQLTTNNSPKIFQLTANAIGYSEFVTKTVNAQSRELPIQINWHLENSTDKFRNYLVTEINQKVLNKDSSDMQGSAELENGLELVLDLALDPVLDIEDFMASIWPI